MPEDTPLLDATIRLDNLPSEGRVLEVVAKPEQKEPLAKRLNIEGVAALKAKLEARPFRDGIRVRGKLSATVSQSCVVTFEPVTETIDESIDRIFLPGREDRFDGPAGAEVFVDLEGDDMPDFFEGPEVDFTELLIETLSLALNPYPRSEGAEPVEIVEDSGENEASPFARLKDLKTTRD